MEITTITKRIVLVFAFALLTTCALPASAVSSQDDASIQAFWTKFKIAVLNSDRGGVAAMSQFPIEMPYGVPAIRTKAQMLKRYRQVFNGEANVAKCFATEQPQKDAARPKEFTVACDNGSGQKVIVYRFVLTKTGWKFKSLDNINE